MIGKEEIDKVRGADVTVIAERVGLAPDIHGFCKCCFHEEKTASMHFDRVKNRWRCYGCQRGGDGIDLVMKLMGLRFTEAVEWILGEKIGNVSVKKIGDDGVLRPLPVGTAEKWRSNENVFCRSLVWNGILSREQMERAAETYKLGTYHDGGVIFWQIDREGRVRDGKIMHYNADSHRSHERKPNWMANVMRRRKEYEGVSRKCLFGLHLVGDGRRVGVVESEKTAVICSAVMPEFVWVASGGMGNLRVEELRGMDVVLFPDTDVSGETYGRWKKIADEAGVGISDVLERNASAEQKERKIDVADYIAEKQ